MTELAAARTTPQPREAVAKMKEYHPPLAGRDRLRLDFNENTFACSPRVLGALAQVAAGDLTKYPERSIVEEQLAHRLQLQPEQVLLTNGVDEAIHILCQAFLDCGDEMLLPVPTYTMYEVYASSTDARIVTVQSGSDFAFPYESLLHSIGPHTKLVCIANPNSPTGSTVTREQILAITSHAPQAIVLVDEAYFHFFGETVIDLIGTIPNLVVARTFSKAYGLAGLRLGMLAAASQTMRWLRRVISPYSVNSLALVCLPAALEDQAYLDWYVAEVKQARSDVALELMDMHVQHWPSAANFILLNIGDKHATFVAAMRSHSVLTRDRSADPGCDGCVRLTIGTREQMTIAMQAMRETLQDIGWKPA